MKYKRILIILCSVLFFLAALTFYINRVLFPQLVKKIAIERIEATLKRRVEIGSIHFNWFRGIIIERIRIYEKEPAQNVFAQADQVSFGILFFPGFKHYRITIPFINVLSPSVHLIRTGADTWNFSDIYAPSPPPAAAIPPAANPAIPLTPPAFEIAWGGITVSDGKFLVDDLSGTNKWSELFDRINLKLALSYKGIRYDFTADIPRKNGFVGATVDYQPVTKNTQAQIHLKNIDTASYLSLINIPDMHLNSGIIEDINLNINYTRESTSAQGNVRMKDLDISNQDQSFKGDIDIRGLDAEYRGGDIKARGQMSLSHMHTQVPGLAAGGSIEAKVNTFDSTNEGVTFDGSLQAQDFFVRLKDREVRAGEVNLDNIKIKKDTDGIQSVGSAITKRLFIEWPNQKLQGDIALRGITMHMKDMNDITLAGSLEADHFSTSLDDKNFSSQHLLLEDMQLNVLDQKNIALNTTLSLDAMTLALGKKLLVSGSLKTDKLLFDLDDGTIIISTTLLASNGKLVLDGYKTIEADPQLELNLRLPLSSPQQLTYKGSITLSDGRIEGFNPLQDLDNVELDVDFQNDLATINALSINILDTNVRINGTVKDFKNPTLDILAEAQDLNLAKIKDLAPRIVDQYGLDFDGTSQVKIKFKGLASAPLEGDVLAVATVKNVNVSSSKFHQRIQNITGIVEATPDSLKWRDFTATYQGQKYNLSGSLNNFKNPHIVTSLDGPGMQLTADMVKTHDLITVNALTGKYLNAVFDSTGTIVLLAGEPVFDLKGNISLLLEDLIKTLPMEQKKGLMPLKPMGTVHVDADLKGTALDWKNYLLNATITSPNVNLMGYNLNDVKIVIHQGEGKVKDLTLDAQLYGGTVHAVGSLDLFGPGMPYDLALNVDSTDLHKLKMDSPLKMEEIDGKLFLTTIAHGTVTDFKNNVHASGSMAIRDGFLGEFNLFKGLLGILNDAMRLGQVMITDVEDNFTIENQKINTDNLSLKGPTIVLLGKGWVNFDRDCDLNVTVDLSSGAVPAIAHDVLSTLNVRIYDKIDNPQFKKKISVPQVINTLLKNLLE